MHDLAPVHAPAVVAILLCTVVLVAYAAKVARHGRSVDARLGDSPGSPLLPGPAVEAVYWACHAPARLLARLGVEPDSITLLSLAVSVASLPAIVAGRFALGGALVTAGALLDVLDGMVARARGRCTASGAVLDSFVDRVADAAPLVGLAVFYRDRVGTLLVPLAALVASSLLSYARAKADEHRLALPNGLMRRHERVTYLVASLVLAPLWPSDAAPGAIPRPATLVGVGVIAIFAAAASFVLVARTRAALREGAASEAARSKGGTAAASRPGRPSDASTGA